MAIAGVHSVAVLDSTFLMDSQSHSQSSGRQEDGGSGGTRSSSLLQMWREVEDEHVVSQGQGRPGQVLLQQRSDDRLIADADLSEEHMPDRDMVEDAVLGENESETWSLSQSRNESHDYQEEIYNSNYENSSDLGEVERGRVRQIFTEWMNSGATRGHASNVSPGNNGSRAEWIEETEQEGLSIIRKQRHLCSGENREEQSSEFGTQIESVREGFVSNLNEGQTEHTTRGIRRLRGRQFLLDMLKKAEMERQREVQELLERQAVSHFPHRNRIQALLRSMFLRNDRSIENSWPTSIAENELGLLRQKQTVSGLREGLFSRKDNSGCSQANNNLSGTTCDSDVDVNTTEHTIEHTGTSSSQMVPTNSGQSETNSGCSDQLGISGGQISPPGTTCENSDSQDFVAHLEIRDWAMSFGNGVERSNAIGQNDGMMPTEDSTNDFTQQSLQIEDAEHGNMHVLREVHIEQSELGDIADDEIHLSHHDNHVEGNTDDVDWIASVAVQGEQQEEVIVENEGSDWHQTNVEWRNSTEEGVVDNHLSSSSDEWPHNILGNEDGENSHLLEAPDVWPEDAGFQEAVEIWLGAPSDHEVPAGRIRRFYFPEDDNVYSVELRELLNRRSVSNLLRSSFRESLDQLIQSYVERQSHAHAHVEWELQEPITSFPLAEQDVEQRSRDRIDGAEDTVNGSLGLRLPPTPPPLPIWDHHARHDNWSQNDDIYNQRLGIEWDIINDMRIDMFRLHQRMNNMQKMMETCMDMQLELQRSIKQEVSAALNRSTGSSGKHDHDSPNDESKWECVRKGLCCICCQSNIDSLLYRCGHMCTCSKCANDLLQNRRKCPMCKAPVVEVIRAYSIQ